MKKRLLIGSLALTVLSFSSVVYAVDLSIGQIVGVELGSSEFEGKQSGIKEGKKRINALVAEVDKQTNKVKVHFFSSRYTWVTAEVSMDRIRPATINPERLAKESKIQVGFGEAILKPAEDRSSQILLSKEDRDLIEEYKPYDLMPPSKIKPDQQRVVKRSSLPEPISEYKYKEKSVPRELFVLDKRQEIVHTIAVREISKSLSEAGMAKEIKGPILHKDEELELKRLVSFLVKGGAGYEVTSKDLSHLEKLFSKLDASYSDLSKKPSKKKVGFAFLLDVVQDLYAEIKKTSSREEALKKTKEILEHSSRYSWKVDPKAPEKELRMDYILNELTIRKLFAEAEEEKITYLVSQAQKSIQDLSPVKSQKTSISSRLIKPIRSFFGSSEEGKSSGSNSRSGR